MNRFEHVSTKHIEDVFPYMQDGWNTRIIAGGTDLLHEMKNGIIAPSRLINIKTIPDLDTIAHRNDNISIGALTTIDDIERSDIVREYLPILAKAAGEAASPQLRNMATLAGNICQRPRCWYYRNPETHCLRKHGKRCFAVSGENSYHAILGGGPCHIVCASDIAPVLMTLDARLIINGPDGKKTVSLDDFFVGPRENPYRENILTPQELITEIVVPSPPEISKGIFLKTRERKSWDFALASVSVQLCFDEARVERAGIVLGGVSPTPWRSKTAENELTGRTIDAKILEKAAQAAVEESKPLRDNTYKITLVKNLVRRALSAVLPTHNH